MDNQLPAARAAIVADEHWEVALEQALASTSDLEQVDIAILFASSFYAEHFPAMLARIQQATGGAILVGCSGQAIIGQNLELEDVPALSLLVLSLPGALLRPVRFTQGMIEECETPLGWRNCLGVQLDEVNAWLLFADPFRIEIESLLDGLASAYGECPIMGGMASSSNINARRTHVFLNDEVFTEGGVGLAIGGSYTLLPLVSQGCEPIGETWTITGVRDNLIQTISNRPAYDMLAETFRNLPHGMQQRAQRNLLVGLAADEYQETFQRGSFLIRPLIGVESGTGALAIGALPRIGQTIQFQMRDARAADLDLTELLDQVGASLGQQLPIAGVLCSCNGRGVGLFGTPNHDACAIARHLGKFPLAGLFCNGEIGPVGTRPFLHGFTASLALLVQK
ncbi:MAG TPA: FIST N-terminal domain-containing protein [Ktedonobacteraceae bacterium]|nr:FIST N-terminal domain-containing protein [Ktedonobacteraceae bacterium]